MRISRLFKLMIGTLPAIILLASPATAEKRIALVVGNSAYINVPRLANPANDARLVADTLRSLGFVLVGGGVQLDLDEGKFRQAVQDFGSQLQGADVGLFYYAGHGVQVRGANYLVPIDANPTREADVDFQMVDGNLVLRQMEGAGTKLNLVLLDACRNNPFGARGLRATGGGLAQMQAPEGTLISFATQPGNVALEGTDGHSPYAEALAQAMRKGLDIYHTFNEVGLAVAGATGGAQQPWIALSPIKGDFYFAAGPAGGNIATAPPDPIVASANPGVSPAPVAPDLKVPNEPLPADVPVDPGILRLVETHPFFTNAPAVTIRKNNIASNSSWTGNGQVGKNSSDDTDLIRWLRSGLITSDITQQTTTITQGGTSQSSIRTISVSAANGEVTLGYKSVSVSNIKNFGSMTTTGTSRTIGLDGIRGTLFPMKVGNRFSYRITSTTTYKNKFAAGNDEQIQELDCEISRRYEAASFHPQLTGGAYLTTCDVKTTYQKNSAANGTARWRSFFFDTLGVWLSVDPVSPREQIVSNSEVSVAGNSTTTINGTYTLRSFELLH